MRCLVVCRCRVKDVGGSACWVLVLVVVVAAAAVAVYAGCWMLDSFAAARTHTTMLRRPPRWQAFFFLTLSRFAEIARFLN